MRDLIISTLAVTLLISIWFIFDNHSEDMIDDFTHIIEAAIIPMVEEENWIESSQEISALSHRWHRYKTIALLFLDTETINEIDYSLAKASKYIKARDVSNASGELLFMHEQLKFLSFNNRISLSNIL